jgi:hypothetical protein
MAQQHDVTLPDDFDDLLRRTLAVEPSAEFLPRVRERVAATTPRRLDLRWAFAGAVALAAVLVLAIWLAPAIRVDSPQTAPVVAAAPPSPLEVPPPSPAVVEAQPPRHAAVREPGSRPRGARNQEKTVVRFEPPAVIVDERQQAAIASVMQLVAEGKLTTESFAGTTPQSVEAIKDRVLPVVVTPVHVSPFAPGGVLQKELNATEPPPAR